MKLVFCDGNFPQQFIKERTKEKKKEKGNESKIKTKVQDKIEQNSIKKEVAPPTRFHPVSGPMHNTSHLTYRLLACILDFSILLVLPVHRVHPRQGLSVWPGCPSPVMDEEGSIHLNSSERSVAAFWILPVLLSIPRCEAGTRCLTSCGRSQPLCITYLLCVLFIVISTTRKQGSLSFFFFSFNIL